ncbi:MAG: hypothetical protein V5789_05925 [Colwellia sp.]
MSISLGQHNSIVTQPTSGAELLTAALSKSQQELAGQLALQLIESVNATSSPAAPIGNTGFQVNIKV